MKGFHWMNVGGQVMFKRVSCSIFGIVRRCFKIVLLGGFFWKLSLVGRCYFMI